MIGFLLQVFLIIVVISVIEIAYNSLVYRQTENKNKLIFYSITIITLASARLGIVAINKLIDVPVLGGIIKMINSIFNSFVNYVPLKPILLWFVVPVSLAWGFYMLKSTGFVVTKKLNFNKWKGSLKLKQQEETQDQMQQEQKDSEVQQDIEIESSIHFLDMEMTRGIKYQNVLGLQRAYELAKKNGLQISETKDGYVAVYSDGKGYKALKKILSENSIDISNLQGRPSLVFFDAEKASGIGIQDQFLKLKEGM